MRRFILLSLFILLPRPVSADCTECHSAYKAKDILKAQDDVSACQGKLQKAVGEILYIEQRFNDLKRISAPLADQDVGYHWINLKMERALESYNAFLEKDMSSLKQLVDEKGKVCEKLRNIYLDINDSRDELKKRHIFGVIVLATLVLLAFGLRAYLHVMPEPGGEEETPGWELDPKRDDEPYKKMAARISWPDVTPKGEED